MSDFLDDLVLPYLKVALAFIVSFLPGLLLFFVIPDSVFSRLLLLIPAAIYLPMAILAMVVLGSFGAVSPHIVIPAILRVGALYWLIVLLLIATFILVGVLNYFTENIFLVGIVLSSCLSMFSIMVNGRLIGLLYRNRAEELAWV